MVSQALGCHWIWPPSAAGDWWPNRVRRPRTGWLSSWRNTS